MPATPPRTTLTPLQQFCDRWKDGCGSTLCDKATKIVLCRGQIPADVLLVGESPGISEDVMGVPFVGPAGMLLDKIVSISLPEKVRVAFCNLVGCLPKVEGEKQEPDPESILKCQPRLVEFIKLANPKLIVCVGKLSEKWMEPGYKKSPKIGKVPLCSITHPAAILRAPIAGQSLVKKRCIVLLNSAWNKIVKAEAESEKNNEAN